MARSGNFACTGCGKEYRWKPELAGKRVKCKCGGVMTVPAESPADDEQDIYGISEADAPTAPKQTMVARTVNEGNEYRCPHCQQSIPPGSAVCPMCGTNLRTGKKSAAAVAAVGAAAKRAPALAPPPGVKARATPAKPKPGEPGANSGKLIAAVVAGVLVIGGAIYGIKVFNGGGSSGSASASKMLPGDQKVETQIKEEYGTEARKWLENETHEVMGQSKKQAVYKVDEFYQMGAKRVMAFGARMSTTLAIELPDDPAKRKQLFEWQRKWNSENFQQVEKDIGQKWMVIGMHA